VQNVRRDLRHARAARSADELTMNLLDLRLRGFTLGDLLLEFLGAFLDTPLQRFARFLQRAVLRLNLVEHGVESLDEGAKLVLASAPHTYGVIVASPYEAHRRGELGDPVRNRLL
jgi:hypothetical protein